MAFETTAFKKTNDVALPLQSQLIWKQNSNSKDRAAALTRDGRGILFLHPFRSFSILKYQFVFFFKLWTYIWDFQDLKTSKNTSSKNIITQQGDETKR